MATFINLKRGCGRLGLRTVHLSKGEEIVFPVSDGQVLKGYDEYTDLPENARISVYSLQEIASEKVLALLDKARNEPRDLYDLWYLWECLQLHAFALCDPLELVRRHTKTNFVF